MTTPLLFRKNIRYEWEEVSLARILDNARKSPEALVSYLEIAERILGRAGLQETCIKLLHIATGVQFVVQKQLSDELDLADFDNSHFEDIAWPAPSIEFYFEDPALPTIIVQHSRFDGILIELAKALWGEEYRSTIPVFGLAGEPTLSAVCDNTAAPTSCTVVHTFETWSEAMKSGACDLEVDAHAAMHQSHAESSEMQRLLNLSLKVLAYSNVPQFKPTPITRKQMGRGPKPGVCGRPARPAYRTIYLPRIVRPAAASSSPSGQTRQFKGRRGTIRWFHSDYFVNKKGQWTYIPPIRVEGVTPPTTFKVRKV